MYPRATIEISVKIFTSYAFTNEVKLIEFAAFTHVSFQFIENESINEKL